MNLANIGGDCGSSVSDTEVDRTWLYAEGPRTRVSCLLTHPVCWRFCFCFRSVTPNVLYCLWRFSLGGEQTLAALSLHFLSSGETDLRARTKIKQTTDSAAGKVFCCLFSLYFLAWFLSSKSSPVGRQCRCNIALKDQCHESLRLASVDPQKVSRS